MRGHLLIRISTYPAEAVVAALNGGGEKAQTRWAVGSLNRVERGRPMPQREPRAETVFVRAVTSQPTR